MQTILESQARIIRQEAEGREDGGTAREKRKRKNLGFR
jgi:hypothetical protein